VRAPFRVALVALVFAGCGSDPVFSPIIDTPPEGSPGYPYVGIDELSIAVAVAGDEGNLRVADFPIDDAPHLGDVPYGRSLVVHMSAKIVGTVSSYGRTCKFDYSAGAPPTEQHLYLARVGRFAEADLGVSASPVGGFSWAMPDGGAGFVGGGVPLARYDVASASYQETDVHFDRDKAAYVALDDGRALIVGGEEGGSAVGEIVAVDIRAVPGPDAPISVASVAPVTLASGAALTDGTAVIAGGEVGGLALNRAQRVILGNEGVSVEALPDLNRARAAAVMTRLGDGPAADVLITGGVDATTAVAQVELYRPLARTFENLDGAVLAEPRWGHQAVLLPDRSVLIFGGYTAVGVTTGSIELFESSTATFRSAPDVFDVLDDRAGRVLGTATPLPDGRILLAGGLDATGEPTAAVFIARLDLQSGAFSLLETDPMAVPRAGHEAVVLCDGTVLIVGGTNVSGAPVVERYNPPPDGRR